MSLEFLKLLEDKEASLAFDDISGGSNKGFLDTGCYMLNAAFSGSIYGGIPDSKISTLAGESSVGKTFIALSVVKNFLINNPTGFVIYYDTESAINREMLESRGIDSKRVIISEPDTIESFKNKAVNAIDKYVKAYEKVKDKPKMLIVLDSLGNLSTAHEVEVAEKNKDTKDMSKAGGTKAAFRLLTLKAAKARVTMIVTNHVYDGIGQGNSSYTPKVLGSGSGNRYTSTSIAMMSKSKDTDSNRQVIGNFITVKMYKSRLSKENKEVKLYLSYTKGLHKYYGLVEIAEAAGIFKKTGIKYATPLGDSVKESTILKKPELYFTKEILDRIDSYIKSEFEYGSDSNDEDVFEDDNTEE